MQISDLFSPSQKQVLNEEFERTQKALAKVPNKQQQTIPAKQRGGALTNSQSTVKSLPKIQNYVHKGQSTLQEYTNSASQYRSNQNLPSSSEPIQMQNSNLQFQT